MFHKQRIPIGKMMSEGALPGPVRRRLYRRRGWSVARDVEFAPGVVIDADEVEIGEGASFGIGTVIRGRSVRIGRRASIGSFCFFDGRDMVVGDDTVIREQVFVGGPLFADSLLEIGKRVRIFQSCFLNPSRPLRIGDETGVGGRSSIFTHGSWQPVLEGFPVAFEPVTIGRNVWLPWHVFILPGVEIGDNATIGAGSVVNRSIPAGALAAGVPAKVLRGPDEWPRRLEAAERWDLAAAMLEQLFLYLEDKGVEVSRGEADGRRHGDVHHGRLRSRVALVSGGADIQPTDDIVLQLAPHTDDGRPRPASWFGLVERSKQTTKGEIETEVEDWLARYGLRFRPLGEE